MARTETFADHPAHDARVAARTVTIANGPYATGSDYWTHSITWSDGWAQLFRSREEADQFVAGYNAPA